MWLKYSFPLVAQILVSTWLKYSLTFTHIMTHHKLYQIRHDISTAIHTFGFMHLTNNRIHKFTGLFIQRSKMIVKLAVYNQVRIACCILTTPSRIQSMGMKARFSSFPSSHFNTALIAQSVIFQLSHGSFSANTSTHADFPTRSN